MGMTGFLQPSVYGPTGVSSDTQNALVFAAQFINANRSQLEALLVAPGVTRQWHAMQIVSSASISANRWEYTLRKAQPASPPSSLTTVGLTELTDVTAYNLAEYGNTAATAAGGVNATRANTQGFQLLKVPNDAFVHAFLMYRADGQSVALFERMNAWDGECVAALVNSVDGGSY
jgi:hypothetical protein